MSKPREFYIYANVFTDGYKAFTDPLCGTVKEKLTSYKGHFIEKSAYDELERKYANQQKLTFDTLNDYDRYRVALEKIVEGNYDDGLVLGSFGMQEIAKKALGGDDG